MLARVGKCCDPRGCDEFFGGGFARRMAARYRKRGLDRTAWRMVALPRARGARGATVLEIGGGVGEIQLELLKRGAERRQPRAGRRVRRRGARAPRRGRASTARVERRLHDIADGPGRRRARRHRRAAPRRLLLPRLRAPARRRRRSRAPVAGLQPSAAQPRVASARQGREPVLPHSGREFRTFAHPPAAMLAVLEARGLQPQFAHRGPCGRSPGSSAARSARRGGPRSGGTRSPGRSSSTSGSRDR